MKPVQSSYWSFSGFLIQCHAAACFAKTSNPETAGHPSTAHPPGEAAPPPSPKLLPFSRSPGSSGSVVPGRDGALCPRAPGFGATSFAFPMCPPAVSSASAHWDFSSAPIFGGLSSSARPTRC